MSLPDFVSQLRKDTDSGNFHGFKIGRFWISIQASRTHYCTPRITTTDLTRYTHWEVYLGPTGAELRKLGIDDAEILEFFGEDDDEPAARVPTHVVQKYLNALAEFDGPDLGPNIGRDIDVHVDTAPQPPTDPTTPESA